MNLGTEFACLCCGLSETQSEFRAWDEECGLGQNRRFQKVLQNNLDSQFKTILVLVMTSGEFAQLSMFRPHDPHSDAHFQALILCRIVSGRMEW